jgi:hypothetical protein
LGSTHLRIPTRSTFFASFFVRGVTSVACAKSVAKKQVLRVFVALGESESEKSIRLSLDHEQPLVFRKFLIKTL